jgi:hypothetical protein
MIGIYDSSISISVTREEREERVREEREERVRVREEM